MSASAPSTGPTRSGPPAVVPAVLVATALVIVLATWAASIGPDRVFGDAPATTSRPDDTTSDRSVVPPIVNRDDDDPDKDNGRGWGSTALLVLELALLVFFLALVAMGARWVTLDIKDERRWRRRRRRRRHVGFEVLPPTPEQAAEEIVRDAGDQLTLLREGTPRNGIVAAWHRFEVQARSAGIGREQWETSAEFTLRMLDLVSADERAVAELAALYREARFSDHEILESTRADAVDALDRIHRSLGARSARDTS